MTELERQMSQVPIDMLWYFARDKSQQGLSPRLRKAAESEIERRGGEEPELLKQLRREQGPETIERLRRERVERISA